MPKNAITRWDTAYHVTYRNSNRLPLTPNDLNKKVLRKLYLNQTPPAGLWLTFPCCPSGLPAFIQV